MKIELEISPRVQRAFLCAIPAILLSGAAVAFAQGSQASATTDTLVGSALNTLGNSVAALRADVTVLQTSERVARATISGAGAVTAQTGSWLRRVEHPSAGAYVFVFAPGAFAAVPTCVTSANARASAAPAVECYDVTTSSATCQATASGAPIDTGISLICAGW